MAAEPGDLARNNRALSRLSQEGEEVPFYDWRLHLRTGRFYDD
jgi:hypothetical protein